LRNKEYSGPDCDRGVVSVIDKKGKRACRAYRRHGGPGLTRGILCMSRECCNLMLFKPGRSPYCSKVCQVREQNMRQGRVKPRLTLIYRKSSRCLHCLSFSLHLSLSR
ncbi:hypothetical protein KIPB_013927, partial [Kipferlia bialata]